MYSGFYWVGVPNSDSIAPASLPCKIYALWLEMCDWALAQTLLCTPLCGGIRCYSKEIGLKQYSQWKIGLELCIVKITLT